MKVITIDSKAFQQLVEKVNLIADYVHEARLEQSTNSDEEWGDSQVVCQYLRICEKTLQRLRAVGKVAYSCVGNKYYYQIAEIKRCLKAHIIKSSDEMLDELIQRSGYTSTPIFSPKKMGEHRLNSRFLSIPLESIIVPPFPVGRKSASR